MTLLAPRDRCSLTLVDHTRDFPRDSHALTWGIRSLGPLCETSHHLMRLPETNRPANERRGAVPHDDDDDNNDEDDDDVDDDEC